jgi:hypothetical protein
MKKVIIIALFGIVSSAAFAQAKKETTKVQPAANDSLVISKDQAIQVFNLLEYCKEAVSTTVSKKITVADANSILQGIVQLQKSIADRYQPKQAGTPPKTAAQ